MATEQNGESAAGEAQRVLPTPFLKKTYQLVDDPAVDDLISWNEDGSGFIIWQPAEFARDLLPKYFKHNNLSSFVRQLNTYGFRKVVPDRWEFANECFKKGEKRLLRDIHRRKMTQPQPLAVSSVTPPAVTVAAVTPPSTVQFIQISPSNSGEEQVFSSTSSPGGSALRKMTNSTTPELVEENERLKKENEQITNELSHLRGLCSNIFMLISSYGPSGQQDPGNQSMESKQLDLLQSGRFSDEQGGSSGGGRGGSAMDDEKGEENVSPKLFGVSIGAKRQKKNKENEIFQMQPQDEAGNGNQNNRAKSDMNVELSHSGSSQQ